MWYKKSGKKSSRQKLIDKLDTIFSKYIRLRDSNEKGYFKCITSGEYVFWKDGDAGHFMSRNHMATRWDEQNVNGQGRADNRFKAGRQYEHGLAIDKKFGKGTADKLLMKSKSACKFEDFELEEMIEKYKKKLKDAEAKVTFGDRTPAPSGSPF